MIQNGDDQELKLYFQENALSEYVDIIGHNGKEKTEIAIGIEFPSKFKDVCSVFSYRQSQVKAKTRRLLLLRFLLSWLLLQF